MITENVDAELKTLLECAFKKQYFHYVVDGIKLPCDGYACKDCIVIDKELNCHSCHETHLFSEADKSRFKIDKLCRSSLNSMRNSFFTEIRERSSKFSG